MQSAMLRRNLAGPVKETPGRIDENSRECPAQAGELGQKLGGRFHLFFTPCITRNHREIKVQVPACEKTLDHLETVPVQVDVRIFSSRLRGTLLVDLNLRNPCELISKIESYPLASAARFNLASSLQRASIPMLSWETRWPNNVFSIVGSSPIRGLA